MAITNASEVKFVYTSDYNNLSATNKTSYADAIIFDDATGSIMLDGKPFGDRYSNDNFVLVTQENWTNSEIWGSSAEPGRHYIIKDQLVIEGENLVVEGAIEIPANSTLEFLKGAGFGTDTDGASTFTILLNHADIISPKQHIFFKSCNLVGYIFNNYIPVEWFGAVGASGTSYSATTVYNSTAVKDAIDHAGGGIVLMSDLYYAFSSNIQIPSRSNTFATTVYEAAKGVNVNNIRKKLLCLGDIVTTDSYDPAGGYTMDGNLVRTNAAISVTYPLVDIDIQGTIFINSNILSATFAGLGLYKQGGFLDCYTYDLYDYPGQNINCNVFINAIVKGTYDTNFTYNSRTETRSWQTQCSLNAGVGVGVTVASSYNSNITVNSVRGFDKAVEVYYMKGTTLTVNEILCNYGFYFRYTPFIEDDVTVIENIDPYISGNTINYSGYTTDVATRYMFVPSDPIYTYDNENDPVHLNPTGVSGFTLKNDSTLFKIVKQYYYGPNRTEPQIQNDVKFVCSRNTFNVKNLGGFWSKLIDGEYMMNNTFNIDGNYLDCKIVRDNNGTPDLSPQYIILNEATDKNIINSSYCSICNVNEFVVFKEAFNNIINSVNLFPYDLAVDNSSIGGISEFQMDPNIINNCTPIDNILLLQSTNIGLTFPSDFTNPFYSNYKSCDMYFKNSETIYVINPYMRPRIFDTSSDFDPLVHPEYALEGALLVTTDSSMNWNGNLLYPLYECTTIGPRPWNNTYYSDLYGLVETYRINSILEQINGN